eukprot:Tamp_18211.p1 GENE.Tamp_18211~~Tamp_18211.p1  ORF type:complete len:370 (+),score=99.60 Tamp_18211:42-1151(+)
MVMGRGRLAAGRRVALVLVAAVVLLAEHGADGQERQRLPAEMAERWGVSSETLARIEELGRQVDAVYQEWVRSRDRGALQQAVELQSAIVELAPKSAEMRASLANLYYYQGDDARAELHARQAVGLNPRSPASQKLLGRVLVQVGRAEEGLPHLQQALALVPQDGECWYKIGTVFFEQGLHRQAVACFRAAGALRKDSLSWLSAAHTLHKLKQRGAAYRLYHAAVRADPANHDAWTDFAFALSDGQFHEWAEWASRKALALRATGDNYFSVGNHLLSQRRYHDARELYLQGAALAPNNPGLQHNLGFACHLSGDNAGAVDAALRTCQVSPPPHACPFPRPRVLSPSPFLSSSPSPYARARTCDRHRHST